MATYIYLNDNKDKVNGFSPTISYDRPIELVERGDEENAHLAPNKHQDRWKNQEPKEHQDHNGHEEPVSSCNVVFKDEAHQNQPFARDIPYVAVYDPPEVYERRGCFIPLETIKATIIKVERDPSQEFHLFNPFLYTLEVEHGPYRWTIERRFRDFQHLHNRLVLYRTGQKMSAPLKRLTTRRKDDRTLNVLPYDAYDGLEDSPRRVPKPRFEPHFEEEQQQYQPPLADAMAYQPPLPREKVVPEIAVLTRRNTWPEKLQTPDAEIIESQSAESTPERKMPKMPLLPDSFLNPDNIELRKGILQVYINGILKMPSLRKHKETEEFLEVSHLSFIHNLGIKEKEGIVKKKPGGQHQLFLNRITKGCCTGHYCDCCRPWDSRWLLVKDSFIAYLYPFTNNVREVMLFDSDFEAAICSRLDEDGVSRGVKIKNYSRDLLIKAKSDRIANQWKQRIDAVLNTTGRLWKETNQFGSFFPVRYDSYAKWFVDGHTFLEHAADMLDSAREEIFITGWWLTPELFMKRPAPIGSQWQLMNILKRKALQGVHVFVMLFKEIELAMMVGSYHAKGVLMGLHPNILVFRHPDPIPVPSVWTHHEKMVVIDQKIAFIGGMDLCFGRWDDYRHKLTDLGLEPLNADAMSPVSGDAIQMIDEDEYGANGENAQLPSPRQPPGGTILKHGETHHVITVDDVTDKYEELVKSGKIKEKNLKQSTPPMTRKKTKMRKRFDEWKEKHFAGEDEEVDPMVLEYQEMVAYLECKDTRGKLWIGKDYANYLYKDICDVEHPYIDYIDRKVMPRTPWHDLSSVVYGCSARDAGRHFIQRWNQIKTDKFNYEDKYPYLVPKSYNNIEIPQVLCDDAMKCTTQVIRSGALWSCGINCKNESIHQAYIHLITIAEHFVYIENQFFVSLIGSSEVTNLINKTLFERICKAHRSGQKFKVIIFLPLMPAFAGELGTNGGMNMQAVLYWTYKSLSKGPNSLFANLEKENIRHEDYIGVYGLRTHAELSGTLVSEVLYIHSKAMIVDDKFAIIGSANLNDRSFLGDRDSEICCYYEDTEFIDSIMDGKPYKSGKFAGSFRRQLLHEHLGLLDDLGKPDPEAKIDLSDFVSDEVISYIKTTARNNTDIYDKVFKVYPTDLVKTWPELTKLKADKSSCMAYTDKPQAMDLLSEINGYIVEFPLHFLSSEDLSPPIWAYQKFGQFAVV